MREQRPFEELKKERAVSQESEAGGRRAVVILFLITVVLSLFFWLKKEIPTFLKQITTPYRMVIEKGGEK